MMSQLKSMSDPLPGAMNSRRGRGGSSTDFCVICDEIIRESRDYVAYEEIGLPICSEACRKEWVEVNEFVGSFEPEL